MSVRGDESRSDEIADILNRCGAIDLDTRAMEWNVGSWKAKEPKPELSSGPSDTSTMPGVENEFTFDKLETKRGNVWVYRHVRRKVA